MANCNKLFHDFDENLNLTPSKKKNLITSREHLRDKIRAHFKENHPDYTPHFWIQGSQKMNTAIRYKDDTCDLDDGIYFFREPDVTATILQAWILDAVKDATDTPPQHRQKCVRVIYKNDYHIDFPVYYKLDKDDDTEHPKLAVKNDDFEESDPKDFIKWFTEEKDSDNQLVRITKYLKAWGDNVRNKMPSGLALTLLACECIKNNDRDDISLRDTLKAIRNRLNSNWSLHMPTCPYDDLFADYDDDKKKYILEQLDLFIEDADKAIEDESNQLKASKLWKKHLGPHFPEGVDEDVDEKEKALRNKAEILSGAPFINRTGNVTEKNTGKRIPDTKNYGE